VSNRPPLKPALHTKTSLLVVVPRYGPIYPLRRSERLKAGAHSTLSSPRCQVLNCKIAHPHYLARREKTQRDKRLKKMRGPARCQSGDGRARPGRTSKETEKRTRTSDTRGKKRGRKSEPPPPGSWRAGKRTREAAALPPRYSPRGGGPLASSPFVLLFFSKNFSFILFFAPGPG
jgi:hypothetical protein